MNPRTPFRGVVIAREPLDEHLVRLRLRVEGVEAPMVSTGTPDEWVSLTVPGQFQARYYTVRRLEDSTLEVDVALHEQGLVTGWARTDCVGDEVGLSAPKGSWSPPPDAGWAVLVGDLTALPAMARIVETSTVPVVAVHAEVPQEPIPGYFPGGTPLTWHRAPPGASSLAALVCTLDWPEQPGYFWMGGESAQMREIRRHLRRDVGWDARHFDVMGYWSLSRGTARREVDPGTVHARGRAAGKSDAEIWADYDTARETADRTADRGADR